MEDFGCDERTEYKIPDKEAWMIIRKVYQDIMGEKSTIAPLSDENELQVPFYMAHVPGKGRAVFASQPVKRELTCDALIWSWAEKRDGMIFIATVFDEGSMLNDPSPVAENHNEDKETEIDSQECTSNEKDLHMDGEYDNEEDDEEESKGDDVLPNTGCISETTGEIISGGACAINYALRDIEAGEEFTCEYSEFDSDEAIDYFSL
eukprot:scaffold51370_cov32-Attheya_sp.AAC.1